VLAPGVARVASRFRAEQVLGPGQQDGGGQQHPAVVAQEEVRVQHQGGALGRQVVGDPTVKPVAAAAAGTVSTRSTSVTSTSGSDWLVSRYSSSTCRPSVSNAEMRAFGLTGASCGTATARRARVPAAVMRIWAATAEESTTGKSSRAGAGAAAFTGAPGEGGGDEARLSHAQRRHPGTGAAG